MLNNSPAKTLVRLSPHEITYFLHAIIS